MNQEIAIIHQDPFGGIVAFHTDGHFPGELELLVNFITHSMPLSRIRNRTDEKKISESSDRPEIEDGNFSGFSRISRFHRQTPVRNLGNGGRGLRVGGTCG